MFLSWLAGLSRVRDLHLSDLLLDDSDQHHLPARHCEHTHPPISNLRLNESCSSICGILTPSSWGQVCWHYPTVDIEMVRLCQQLTADHPQVSPAIMSYIVYICSMDCMDIASHGRPTLQARFRFFSLTAGGRSSAFYKAIIIEARCVLAGVHVHTCGVRARVCVRASPSMTVCALCLGTARRW